MKIYTYYVYHILGVKVGCTCSLNGRMKDQGFTEYEILWEGTGDFDYGWIAGDKEIEFQKQYNYKKDNVHYQQARINRRIGVIKRNNSKKGIRNGNAGPKRKFTDKEIIEIKKLKEQGLTFKQLMQLYNLTSPSALQNAIHKF